MASSVLLKITTAAGAGIGYTFEGDLTQDILDELQGILKSVKAAPVVPVVKRYGFVVTGHRNPEAVIPGIKAIRELTKIGLKEAKDISDRLRDFPSTPVPLPGEFRQEQVTAQVLADLRYHFRTVEVIEV